MSETTVVPGSPNGVKKNKGPALKSRTERLGIELPKLEKKDPVAVRDYATSYGYSGIVNWDGTNVTIGGKAFKPMYVNNGTAYLDRSQVDDAISDVEERSGIIGGDKVLKMVDDKYGNDYDNALSAVLERDEFSYDPDDDIVYKAYEDMYTREANEAMRRVFNDNNTYLSGASGAVLSEAMAKRDDSLGKLTDKIPELAEDAYERYLAENERLYSNLEAVGNAADSYYDRLYTMNRDAVDDLVTAGESERDEMQRWVENERNAVNDYYDNELDRLEIAGGNIDLAKGNIDLKYYDANAAEALRAMQLENDGMVIENEQAPRREAYENAAARGFYVSDDAEYMPWLSDYRSGDGSYLITPWSWETERQYENQKAKNRADYEAMIYGY